MVDEASDNSSDEAFCLGWLYPLFPDIKAVPASDPFSEDRKEVDVERKDVLGDRMRNDRSS